ncbi:MAG: hypothetical protein ACD_71C00196G0003 [uncultured bacterium (gcode 4)]|uniref:Uncharacterized protein n=1 Tax=uncultured bacterium (gcode 4) TaxID=1234023 RepID=K2A2M9_9BACT|nr:MAG: hypothetical protein ACD_71C00196G0003 [uncultured bacterium (gcode 4)]
MKNIINKELLLKIIEEAIKSLYKNDIDLIEYKSSERNIMATLNCYLKSDKRLSDYDIDIEYNREWGNGDSKRDYNKSPNTADLLIHTRWSNSEWNLLYLEAKTYFNITEKEKENDINTIRFCKTKFSYEYWMFICFNKENVKYELYYNQSMIQWTFNFWYI